jgi:hypothetical protein
VPISTKQSVPSGVLLMVQALNYHGRDIFILGAWEIKRRNQVAKTYARGRGSGKWKWKCRTHVRLA